MKNYQQFNKAISKSISSNGNEILLFANDNVENIGGTVKVHKNTNVCCVNEKKEVLWWIQDFTEFFKMKTPSLTEKEIEAVWKFRSYTNIWIENEQLMAFNCRGFTCKINVQNGEILEVEFEK